MHELKVVDGNVHLDGFRLKGVKEYAIKRSAAQGGSAEITLTLIVGSINKSPGQPEIAVTIGDTEICRVNPLQTGNVEWINRLSSAIAAAKGGAAMGKPGQPKEPPKLDDKDIERGYVSGAKLSP